MLNSSCYFLKSNHGGLKIMKNPDVVRKGVEKNRFYVPGGSFVSILFALHIKINVDRAKLWHLRLAHICVKGMQELSKRVLFCGDKIQELDSYEN